MYRVAVITLSDKGARGEREDVSGQVIEDMVKEAGYKVVSRQLLSDDRQGLTDALISLCDSNTAELILTTGGTGFSPRDNAPEATLTACERMAPGIAEAMRMASLQITPRAMLSRAVSGIRKKTLIVNLPGSPKAVKENLSFILPTLDTALPFSSAMTAMCTPMSRLGGVILAAGLSSRMKQFKPLMMIDGKSMIRHVIDLMRGAGAETIVVVTGHNRARIEAHLADAGVLFRVQPRLCAHPAARIPAHRVVRITWTRRPHPHLPRRCAVGFAANRSRPACALRGLRATHVSRRSRTPRHFGRFSHSHADDL